MLDLRRLHVLAAVDRFGTMTAAAAHLHITTSTVSQQIALLEKDVGMPLFDRTGRTVRINEAGASLVAHYRRIVAVVEEAESSLARFRTGVEGAVRISTFPSFASAVLPTVLMALRERYPQLELLVMDTEPHESVARLRDGEIDVAVVDNSISFPGEGVDVIPLARDEIVLCLPPHHRPAPADPAHLADFADEAWVMDAEHTGFEAWISEVCLQAGFTPRVVAHCSNLVAALGLVRAGFGVALMSSLNLGRETEDLMVRHVEPAPYRELRILVRSATRNSPVVGAVVGELSRVTREHYRRENASIAKISS
ncbi:LysR substrate-binding domain-containing protein [Luteococcus sp. H138]|uniref:LysR family transcriptional regulator n=1 Tax=unclassified Luteococcus TaxID=2639923 RepID=UPI00313A7720